MSDASGGGFNFTTLLSVAALVVAGGSAVYTSSIDSRGQVADLEGSVRSLTTNINERPDADMVRTIVAETVEVPSTEQIQTQIDATADQLAGRITSLNNELGTLREVLSGAVTDDEARAIAARAAADADEALLADKVLALVAESAIPSGAVVAFATSCPTHLGWREREDAAGRFLVAVGPHEDRNGAQREFVAGIGLDDGEYEHTLSEAEMPTHQHAVDRQGPTRGIRDVPALGSDGAIIATIETELTHPSGGGQAHNNLPPYIALHFCEKL
jgi:hypothetical protein